MRVIHVIERLSSRRFLLAYKVAFMSMLIVGGLFVLSVLLSAIDTTSVGAASNTSSARPADGISDSPNVVTSGMAVGVHRLGKNMESAERTLVSATQTAASAGVRVGRSVGRGAVAGTVAVARGTGRGVMWTGRTVGRSVVFVGRVVGKGVGFVFRTPGNVIGFVSNTRPVRAVIRPSDHVDVPIIDPDSPELHAAIAALPPEAPASQPTPQSNAGPVWPLRGRVTTEFGVSHRPFQHTHSGIDITDGQRSPIKPFRPGRVVETVRSNRGLGNHVIVDHGSGVTSVYAHLSSISVQVGHDVGLETVLGIEGSTGVSTGTHLHFEIRVNGQAANPRQFIGGQP